MTDKKEKPVKTKLTKQQLADAQNNKDMKAKLAKKK
tara:strand:+ start:6957 stop:7064 length:108 start_codon:yes stop_codon:yes gene_type:complete